MNNTSQKKPDWFKILINVSPLVVLIFWGLNWYWVGEHFGTAVGGQFGDRFGAATSLFGGLTVVLLLITIRLQRQEIDDGKVEFKQQNRTLIHQRFENTFFQLLKFHADNVASIDVVGENERLGRDCFRFFYDHEFKGFVTRKKRNLMITANPNIDPRSISDQNVEDGIALTIQDMKVLYGLFYEEWQSDLAHYFKTIYRIVKFIDEANHFEGNEKQVHQQKKFYTGILRSQFSTYEALLIVYNGLGDHGTKMKPLIEKYGLLKGVEKSKLFVNPHEINQYQPSAIQ